MTEKKRDSRVRRDRRSISVKGLTYDRLKEYCDARASSLSGALEDLIKEKLDGAGIPVPEVRAPKPPPPPPPAVDSAEVDEQARKHFTF